MKIPIDRVFLLLFLVIIGFIAFGALYTPSKYNNKGIRSSSESSSTTTLTSDDQTGGGGGGDTSSSSQSPSSSGTPLSVTVNSLTSISIRSDTLTSSTGFFHFQLFQDEDLKISLNRGINIGFDVYVVVREDALRGDTGFVWTNIYPQFEYARTYWLRILPSDITGEYTLPSSPQSVPKTSFKTMAAPVDTSSPSAIEKIEENCREFGEYLLQMALSAPFEMALELLIRPRQSLIAFQESFEYTKAKYKQFKNATKESMTAVKQSAIAALEVASMRFLIFIRLFDFRNFGGDGKLKTINLANLTGTLKLTMNRLIKFIGNIDLNAVVAAAKNGIKYGVDGAKAIATRIGMAVLRSARFAASMLRPDPIDIALMAISMTGMVFEDENKGGMMDWNYLKTSDFLSYQSESIKMQHEAWLNDYKITAFPLINGPLNKYDEITIYQKLEELSDAMIFLPYLKTTTSGDNTGYYHYANSRAMDQLAKKALKALSPTRMINDQDTLNDIEDLEVMRDLRSLQRTCFAAFKKHLDDLIASGSLSSVQAERMAIPFSTSTERYATAALEAFAKSYVLRVNVDKMHRLCIHLLCKMDGGNPLRNGQCSYSTPSDCFNSYPWPLPQPAVFNAAYIESKNRVCSPLPGTPCPSPSPCPVSPCLELNSDLGQTDHIYSEWRYPKDMKREFKDYNLSGWSPVWEDPNAVNGACIVYRPDVRQMCEASTKVDEYASGGTKIVARNNYNLYTGECTNTREFCTAYGVSYRSDMPTSEMANRGSGSLPSCYWSDAQKAGAAILGSDIIVQYFERFGAMARNGFATFAGFFSSADEDAAAAARAEAERLAAVASTVEAQLDDVQQAVFDRFYDMKYIHSNTIQCIDFKIDQSGNMYVLYAYDTGRGLLKLVKFNKFFEKQWIVSTGFVGPVENFFQSQLALDSSGYVYFVKSERNANGTYVRSICKLDPNDDGTELWKIKPMSVIDPGGIYAGAQDVHPDASFNGIYIRNDKLYATWVGQRVRSDGQVTAQLQKLIRYDQITSVRNNGVDVISGNETYMTDGISDQIGEEIFSFVVDSNENHYSLYRNNYMDQNTKKIEKSTGLLTRYTAITGARRDFPLQMYVTGLPTGSGIPAVDSPMWKNSKDSTNPDFIHPDVNDYPSICIDSQDRIFISNGVKIIQIDETAGNAWDVLKPGPTDGGARQYNAYKTVYDLKEYDFNTIKNSFNNPDFKPWDCSVMTTDNNDNLCMFIEKTKYVNLGNINRILQSPTTYKNIIYNKLDPPIPNTSIKGLARDPSNVRIFVDYVQFDDLEFNSNCYGHEQVTLIITPNPIQVSGYKDTDMISYIEDIKLQTVRSETAVLPEDANKIIFQLNTNYTISLKINDDIVYTRTDVRIDTTDPMMFRESKIDIMNITEDLVSAGVYNTAQNIVLIPPIYGTRTIQVENIGTGVITNLIVDQVTTKTTNNNIILKIPVDLICKNNIARGKIYKIRIRFPTPYNNYPILRCDINKEGIWIGNGDGNMQRKIEVTYINPIFQTERYTSTVFFVSIDNYWNDKEASKNIYPMFDSLILPDSKICRS